MATSHKQSPKWTGRNPEPGSLSVVALCSAGGLFPPSTFYWHTFCTDKCKPSQFFGDYTMRHLMMLLCFFCVTSVAVAGHKKTVHSAHNPVRTLNLYEPLPEYIHTVPMEVYTQWAKAHNDLAYGEAQYRAQKFNKRYPRPITTVVITEYAGNPQEHSHHQSRRTNIKRGILRQTHRTYISTPWGGGPVLLINPYFRK